MKEIGLITMAYPSFLFSKSNIMKYDSEFP